MKELAARADVVVDWIRQLAQRTAVFFPRRVGECSFRFEPVAADSAIRMKTSAAETIFFIFVPPDIL